MIVFDCSAAVKMTRATSCGLGFRCLILENERVIASELFRTEVRNASWKYVRAGFLPFDEAEVLIAKALTLVDEFIPPRRQCCRIVRRSRAPESSRV